MSRQASNKNKYENSMQDLFQDIDIDDFLMINLKYVCKNLSMH